MCGLNHLSNDYRNQQVESRPIKVNGLYSDLLFLPWWCVNSPLHPTWVSVDNVDRIHRPTVQEFRERYEVS